MRNVLSIAVVLAGAMTLTACSTTEKTASTVGGALVGATVGGIGGAVAGELIGRYRDDPTKCVWEDRNGRRYLAPCSPNG